MVYKKCFIKQQALLGWDVIFDNFYIFTHIHGILVCMYVYLHVEGVHVCVCVEVCTNTYGGLKLVSSVFLNFSLLSEEWGGVVGRCGGAVRWGRIPHWTKDSGFPSLASQLVVGIPALCLWNASYRPLARLHGFCAGFWESKFCCLYFYSKHLTYGALSPSINSLRLW